MYLYKQKTKKGDVYLAIKEKYYVPGTGSREKTIEKIGYLSELQKTIILNNTCIESFHALISRKWQPAGEIFPSILAIS